MSSTVPSPRRQSTGMSRACSSPRTRVDASNSARFLLASDITLAHKARRLSAQARQAPPRSGSPPLLRRVTHARLDAVAPVAPRDEPPPAPRAAGGPRSPRAGCARSRPSNRGPPTQHPAAGRPHRGGRGIAPIGTGGQRASKWRRSSGSSQPHAVRAKAVRPSGLRRRYRRRIAASSRIAWTRTARSGWSSGETYTV